MKIEKLSHTNAYAEGIGFATSVDDIIDKLNEAIDALNQLLALHKMDYKEE